MKVFGNYFILVPTIVFPLTVTITYTIAVYSKHVTPIWPYISHTGNYPIESCVFSLGFNIVAGFYLLIAVLRYSQIEHYYNEPEPPFREIVKKINTSSLPFGITASVTLSIAASFQQIYLRWIHPTAAIVCSYTALAYFWHQTCLSFQIPPYKGKRAWLRLALSIISSAIHILLPVTWFPLVMFYPKTHEETLWWSPDEPGFYLYISGSIMEWIIFMLNEIYVASFYTEFKLIQICKGEIVFL